MRDGTSTRLLPICSLRFAVMPAAVKIGKKNTVGIRLSVQSIFPDVKFAAAMKSGGAWWIQLRCHQPNIFCRLGDTPITKSLDKSAQFRAFWVIVRCGYDVFQLRLDIFKELRVASAKFIEAIIIL